MWCVSDSVDSADEHPQADLHSAQSDLFDSHRDQLAIAERRATWKAFAAPLTSQGGAVVENPDLVEMAVAVISVFSEHPSEHGMTFAQIREGLRSHGVGLAPADIETRLGHFHAEGFLEPYLPKLHQGRYVIRPAGLV